MKISRDPTDRFARSTIDGKFFRKVSCGAGCDKGPNITGFPVITSILIAANTLLFFATPGDMIDRLCSLPLEDFGLPHLILTTTASALFHLNFGHLLMNMILLGIFGVLLEPRLTPGQYLATILMGSVLSSLISLNLLVSQVNLFDASIKLFRHPPAGASGAIAGLMGLFVLRCGASWRSVSRSIRRHPLVLFPVPVSAVVLIGLFYIIDFTGNAAPADGLTGTADFWGHVGGFLSGLVLALVFALQDEDSGERREDSDKCLNSGLKEDADYRQHLGMVMPVTAKASTVLFSSYRTTFEGHAPRN